MPDTETQGEGFATLEAVVIRADGTVEEFGIIAGPPEEPEEEEE